MTSRKFRSALFLLAMGLMRQSSGFAALSTPHARLHAATNGHQTMDTSTSALSAFATPDDLSVLLDSPLLTTFSTLLDPNVESEVLTDVSLALDFTSLLSCSSKALLKKTSVIGRILVISAEYLPDRSIHHPEELVMQLFMLGLAIKNLTPRSMEI